MLNNGTREALLLDGDLHFDTSRVGFGPDKACVDNPDFVQASKFAQTESQQFLRLWGGTDPAAGRLQPSLAVFAGMKNALSWDALRNIHRQSHTVMA